MTLHLPLSLADGRSSKANKISSSFPNSIPLDIMSSMNKREDMRKKPIFIFYIRPVVTLQLPVCLSTKIFKLHYLGFFSSDFKAKDSSRNLLIEIIYGEKPIFIFLEFHLHKSL